MVPVHFEDTRVRDCRVKTLCDCLNTEMWDRVDLEEYSVITP